MGSSWLPEEWPKIVVALGVKTAENNFDLLATGFLVQGESGFPILITAKHVILGGSKEFKRGFFACCNSLSGPITRIPIDEIHDNLSGEWVAHPDKKVDLVGIPFPINFKAMDLKVMHPDLFGNFSEIMEGDDLFFLGFPLKITAANRIKPVVRAGCVALKDGNNNFLIEGQIFPGNSGGPIFLKPSFIDFKERTLGRLYPAKLIGIVSSFVQYSDVAISRQTGRPRVVFEENSGLGNCVSTDCVSELLKCEKMQIEIQNIKKKLEEANTPQEKG